MPDNYYYFVPDSGWGSSKPFPNNCLDPNFVYCIDGAGLNLGCPLRLHAALACASKLGRENVDSCVKELGLSTKHLSAVEELLWADIWMPEVKVLRAVHPKTGRWYDWDISTASKPIRLEVKFHKSDWPRVEDAYHLPIPDKILASASGQLTETGDHYNVVGITLMETPRLNYLAALEGELAAHTNIDAVILKSFAGDIGVYSMTQATAEMIASSIVRRPADQFQLFYTFIENISQKNDRLAQRSAQAVADQPSQLSCVKVQCLPPRKMGILPDLPYRVGIDSRDPLTDEPHFYTICPY